MADPRPRLRTTVRSAATLAGLGAVAPLNAALTFAAIVRGGSVRRGRELPRAGRTVLITGGKMTKALALARAFDRAGHRVILAEGAKYRLTGHRFSRAVSRFHVIPEPGADDYAEAIERIVDAERADVFVPVSSPLSSRYEADAGARIADRCEVVHGDPETVRTVDDKYEFATAAARLGLPVPDTRLITDPAQVADFDFAANPGPYILKSIAYDPIRRLDLTPLPRPTASETRAFAESLPISTERPWILQELVAGQEFCTHSTVRDGELTLHCCCRSSAFQLNYEMVDHPAIEAWVRRFARELRLTGQYSFDFIETETGELRAIECNPRTHSAITMFYDHPGVADAYLGRRADTVVPTATSRPTHWIYNELWHALRRPRELPRRLRTIARGKDAIFDRSDPLPFLLVHHLQIPSLLARAARRGEDWIRIDFNIGKLVEPGGD
ncbi:ATP-grasp enzyme [Thermoleophilia bacterium SCSIO 60948]|nr:ATP-grasp enzyme [Thermoleophilia bacterium SCSIO 60948]